MRKPAGSGGRLGGRRNRGGLSRPAKERLIVAENRGRSASARKEIKEIHSSRNEMISEVGHFMSYSRKAEDVAHST
jgi:hypothetical protein